MSAWFEGSIEIECTIQHVKTSVEDHGSFYAGVVGRMPGLTSVELIEQGNDHVTIRTNEGLMKRSNIRKSIDNERVRVEFDEDYEASLIGHVLSHYDDTFTANGSGVTHRTVISRVRASGILGFLYRNFGSASIGGAVLDSNKAHLEGEGT